MMYMFVAAVNGISDICNKGCFLNLDVTIKNKEQKKKILTKITKRSLFNNILLIILAKTT